MQRACAAALLSGGVSVIHNPGHSNDDKAALDIIRRLGARVESAGDAFRITGNGVRPIAGDIDCGESGLSIRMFTPLVALSDKEITINGSGSLATRPMNFFDEILPLLGVSVRSNKGRLPLVIKGPVKPKDIEIDGSLSSQFLTGLLMAYAAADARNVSIKVKNLKSRPYIDLTLRVMQEFGLKMPENRNYESFYFKDTTDLAPDMQQGSRRPRVTNRDYTVESDWSGGAFLLVAGAVAGNITVRGLDVFSTQADKAILQALADSGAGLSVQEKQIDVRALPLKAFHFNATDCPDLFPPLVALAAYCNGTTAIEGASRLAHKESDRALTLQQEFGKMGVEIVLQDDLMLVKGGNGLHGATVHSHHDHRIAMACAVAALKASGPTVIEEADAINKSYPDFYAHIQSLGASVSLNNQPIKQ